MRVKVQPWKSLRLLSPQHLAHSLLSPVASVDIHFKRSVIDQMAEENTGSNLIWAVAMIIIVAIIAGAVYYSGLLSGNKKREVDVEIKAPAVSTK
jgi:hypothetical protein